MESYENAARIAIVDEVLADHAGREGALLPVLHDVQERLGWIDEASIRAIAQGLNLSRAEVHGVVSFYHDFRTRPEARPVLKLCRAESCQARGSEPLAQWAEGRANGRVAIETVYCLGLCSVGPNAMAGNDLHARLDRAALGALIDTL